MRAILIVGAVLVTAGAGLRAQDPLTTAKDLYASAAYEDALSVLSGIDGHSAAPEVSRQADQYRAFCLYALGRTHEAESIAEAMIRREPLLRLEPTDASPRIQAMFAEVRKRLLPSLIRDGFRTARSTLDEKGLSDAEPTLIQVKQMIAEAERLGVEDEGRGDLTVLVDGFLQLIKATAEQRTPPQIEASVSPAARIATAAPGTPAPTLETGARPASGSGRSPAAGRPATGSGSAVAARPPAAVRAGAASPTSARNDPRVYSPDDQDVTPPVAIDQRLPPLPDEVTFMLRTQRTAPLLDLLIDDTGRVAEASMRRPVNVVFDGAILRAARAWKYRPAIKDGVPVRYFKTVGLVP